MDTSITSHLEILVALAVAALVMALFTVFSNAIVFLAILLPRGRNRTAKTSYMTSMFMCSMAVSDTILGALVMPLSVVPIIQNGEWKLGKITCSVYLGVLNIVCSVNAFHILCLAVDKYVAVCRPLQYRLMKKYTAQCMICASWLFPITVTLLLKINGFDKTGLDWADKLLEDNGLCFNVLNSNVLVVYLLISFYSPIIVTYFLYARIFSGIWSFNNRSPQYELQNSPAFPKERKKLNSSADVIQITILSDVTAGHVTEPSGRQSKYTLGTDKTISKNSGVKISSNLNALPSTETRIPRHISKHMRAIRTIGCIVTAFTVCWMPTSLYLVIIQYTGTGATKWSCLLSFWLSFLNSLINPFLCCGMKSVRVKVRHLTGL